MSTNHDEHALVKVLKLQFFPVRNPDKVKPPTVLLTDLKQLFVALNKGGRYRDWVRRVVSPILGIDQVYSYNIEEYPLSLGTEDYRKAGENNYLIHIGSVMHLTDLPIVWTPVKAPVKVEKDDYPSSLEETSPLPKMKITISVKPIRKANVPLIPKLEPLKPAETPAPAPAPAAAKIHVKNPYLFAEEGVCLAIPLQGYSNNYMYHQPTQLNGRVVKTPGYNKWKKRAINELRLADTTLISSNPAYKGVDFTKPLSIDMGMTHRADFDTNNLTKSMIDAIAAAFDFNDRLVKRHSIIGTDIATLEGQCTTIFISNL